MITPPPSAVDNNLVQGRHSLRGQGETFTLVAALCAATLPLASLAQTPTQSAGALRIEATGFHDESGHAIAKLFLPGQNVRQHGRIETQATIKDGKASFIFPDLLPGDYAVVVFHDANDNGEIDHNLIGIAKEGLGFSNAFQLSLTSGLPTFDKLKFAHGASEQTIHINVESL